MGPLMLDCKAEELLPEEREKLAHPVVGGVILFTRNYHDKRQLSALIKDIRASANKPVLVAVDHEGGRVQRFRHEFTLLPAMGDLSSGNKTTMQSDAYAKACGLIMAYELKSLDIDFSFAPVLDINGVSQVIGDRAFADNSDDVVRLAAALIEGLKMVNMPAVGKHFPGHGSVAPDSHIALPVDERDFAQINSTDMITFSRLIQKNFLDGVMPAHVIYSKVCGDPAGFSDYWLQTVLKQSLGFRGAIFSDDLSMHGASVAGSYIDRAEAAIKAGCDIVLACNNPKGAEEILDGLESNVAQQITKYGEPKNNALHFYGRKMPTGLKNKYEDALSLLNKL